MNFAVLLAVVALNQDATQFQGTFPPDKMTEAGAIQYFDAVVKKGVTHFLICPANHNTMFDSQVWDNCWRDGSALGLEADPGNLAVSNSKLLHERGVDHIGIWIRRARERGVSPWFTMRMNDVHFIDKPLACRRSAFWTEHPEFRRKPGFAGRPWDDAAYDFAHPEVRAHALALVRELLEKWDVDGLECDWLRFPHHVTEAEERAQTGHVHLTAVMREVKRLVDEAAARRGHPILVGVRVASRPDRAFALGTDVETWAREGLVDWVTPCNFFNTLDFALPMAEWCRLVHAANPNVRVLGGCDFAGLMRDVTFNGYKPVEPTLAEVAGYYERLVDEGAQGAAYFNRFGCRMDNPMHVFVQNKGVPMDGELLRRMDRAYAVTRIDTIPAGWDNGSQLPTRLSKGATLRIPIGKAGSLAGARVRIAFSEKPSTNLEDLVKLNGASGQKVEEIDGRAWLGYPDDTRPAFACEFRFPAAAVCDGTNTVSVLPVRDSTLKVRACELYLDAACETKISVNTTRKEKIK